MFAAGKSDVDDFLRGAGIDHDAELLRVSDLVPEYTGSGHSTDRQVPASQRDHGTSAQPASSIATAAVTVEDDEDDLWVYESKDDNGEPSNPNPCRG